MLKMGTKSKINWDRGASRGRGLGRWGTSRWGEDWQTKGNAGAGGICRG